MRKLHPSYEMFVKEQKPKYGATFLEWYAINHKLGDIDLLKELQEKNKCYKESEFIGHPEEQHIYYFKDFFTKKLQLCQNLCGILFSDDALFRYNLDVVADVMDLYEDVIQEICVIDNVYVCFSPSIIYKNRACNTDSFNFKTLDEFKEEISTGIVIMYHFKILEDFSIEARYFKWEPLTRKVLFEKQ